MQQFPNGTRVVLIKDNADGERYGRKGQTGFVADYDVSYIPTLPYKVRFDNGETWWIDAASLALECDVAVEDCLLALMLATEIELDTYTDEYSTSAHGQWINPDEGDDAVPMYTWDWLRQEALEALAELAGQERR